MLANTAYWPPPPTRYPVRRSVDEGPRDPVTTVSWVGQGEGSGWPRGSRVQLHSLKSKEHNGKFGKVASAQENGRIEPRQVQS